MSASASSRVLTFVPIIASLVFFAGCSPDALDLGQVTPPQPLPDPSVTSNFRFEADEMPPLTNGSFTVGDDPLTTTFTGGSVEAPENTDLARSPTQAWLIAEGESGTITFNTPATRFEFFFRDEFKAPTRVEANGGVVCDAPPDLGNNPGEAFGATIYVRGGFNDWAGEISTVPTDFVNLGGSTYQAQFTMAAGTYEFKLADEGWTFEYTNGGDVPVGVATELPGAGDNASITIPSDGCYTWTVTLVDDSAVPAPVVSLLVEEFVPDTGGPVVCDAPPDVGNNPGEAFGATIYVRGGFNDWAGEISTVPTDFVNLGGGTYQAQFTMVAGTYEFKLADEGWTFEYTNGGDVPVGVATELPGAGDNASITIPSDGCYTWTVTLVDDSAVPAPVVSLLVEEFVGSGGGATVCEIPELGNNPGEAFGAPIYVRGGFNDWAGEISDPSTQFINQGSGVYKVAFEMVAGTYEFKLADEGWTFEYTNGGDVPVGVTTELPGAGDNASITIPSDGCYSWTVTLVDDSAVPAPVVSLLVEEFAGTPVGGDVGSLVRVFDVTGAEIDSLAGSTLYRKYEVVRGTDDTPIRTIQIDNMAGLGFVAIDDFEWTAIPQTEPTIVTLAYKRPDGDYSATEFVVTVNGNTETVSCIEQTGFCGVQVSVPPGGDLTYFVTNGGVPDEGGEITIDPLAITDPDGVVINFEGSGVPLTSGLPEIALDDNEVILYYKRGDDIYDGWGLHLFPITTPDWTEFPTPGEYTYEGIDPVLGAYFIIGLPGSDRLTEPYSRCTDTSVEGCDLTAFPESLGFIIHKGNSKDPGPDQFVRIAQDGNIIFVRSGVNSVGTTPPVEGGVMLDGAGAHWVTQDTLVWTTPDSDTVRLLYSADGGIREAGGNLVGADMMFDLGDGTSPALPNSTHLQGLEPWSLPVEAIDMIDVLITGQLIAVGLDADGNQVEATAVQIPLVLDDLFAEAASNASLGVNYDGGVPELAVWAPTSTMASVNIYDTAEAEAPSATLPMTYDPASGIWTITGTSDWDRKYYTYSVTNYVPQQSTVREQETTDPYSINIAMGGTNMARSQMINLDDVDLKPLDWDTFAKPPLAAPEDIVLYELHVRDFSALDDSVMPDDQGRYTAFAGGGSGTAHLADLAAAGLTHVHILPAFDLASVNEDETQRVDLNDPIADLCALNAAAQPFCDVHSGTILEALESYADDASDQQELVNVLRSFDSFNWGYDPVHFNTPEGSYASDANNESRILEFRQMVKGLSDIGLRTMLDQVYNHTNASGTSTNAVFDKVVPGYYHRYDAETGAILRETCCDDTAAEHAMMSKFLVDSMVFWAKHYKIDGFRIDLMSFHPLSTMEQARDELQALTLETDGVDGSKIYVYGEGWLTGVAADDSRFIGASQANLAGSGIGSFNDRIRDGVRGGGPFDSGQGHIDSQGFISGQFYDPNGNNSGAAGELDGLLFNADRIRIGLAGGLSSYTLTLRDDTMSSGGGGAGYTSDPQEIVNYAASHDGETLWDISQYKHPTATTTADRVRAQNLGNAIVLLSQGVPFLHAGQDLLRSKSMDRNSFDSGDWFNFLDFTADDNNFAVGLPPSGDNNDSYTEISGVLANPAAFPGAAGIMFARDVTQEFLQIRKSTGLFRLQTEGDVNGRVSFHNTGSAQVPGLIVMSIDGCVTGEFTPEYGSVVAVFNANDEAQVFDLFGERTFDLHPVQMSSVDSTVATAFHDASGFNVPARTAAVFVETQSGISCGCAPVEDVGNDPAEAFGAELFARGGFNDWGAGQPYNFVNLGDGTYKARFGMSAGSYEFKLADQDWTFEYTNSGSVTVGTAADLPSGGGSNASITIAEDGCYEWTVSIVDGSAVPAPLISLLVDQLVPDEEVACQAPADLGNDPAEAFGAGLFARGGFNDWAGAASDPPTNFVNLGGGVYQARFSMS
ncbi:MAG: pullulanase-type alpha-1,6-glucosidase, partial [Gammaproteobacteria bacterium]|nr:pullulanase-type alpha-1,6-glucosidase [Gammaproteobacteria bacterium]